MSIKYYKYSFLFTIKLATEQENDEKRKITLLYSLHGS